MQNDLLKKFKPCRTDTWQWRLALLEDHVEEIHTLATAHYLKEMSSIVEIDHNLFRAKVREAILQQCCNLAHCQLLVCKDAATNRLLAYSWITRGAATLYSQDELAQAELAHIDQTLDAKTKIHLMTQILWLWEQWARSNSIPVLVSTTIRTDQQGFLKLHARLGFDVRGSIAYKKI